MNKSMLTLGLLAFLAAGITTSCNLSPSEKVRNAQEDVVEANDALDRANEAYLADMRNYKNETADKIAINNQRIADFNAQIVHEQADAKSKYKMQIDELETRNDELKARLGNYSEEGKDNWDRFKVSFNREMDSLGQAFDNFTKTDKP